MRRAPCILASFVTASFATAAFVTPALATPAFVTPAFVTPALVTPAFVTPAFVTLRFVTLRFMTLRFITAAFATAAFATLACDLAPGSVAAPATAQDAPAMPAAPSDAPVSPEAEAEAEPAPAAPAPLAKGDRMLEVATHAEDGVIGCGPCRTQGGPRLLVLGSLEAISRGDTWRDLDAIAQLYADNGLHALAIVAPASGGRLHGVAEPGGLAARAAKIRSQQRIAMAVDVAAAVAADDAKAIHALATIVEDPTVVLTSEDGTVRWIGTARPHWRPLDMAIAELLAPR